MLDTAAKDAGRWVTEKGLAGASESELLCGFASRLHEAGVPLSRCIMVIDTLHPVYEGRVFRWRRDEAGVAPMSEYQRTSNNPEAEASWRRSPFFHLLETGESQLRVRIDAAGALPFDMLSELRDLGQTDYLALIHRFTADGVIGEMDCIYSSWTSDAPGGFTDEQIALLSGLAPSLGLAVKCASLTRIAGTLVETYLGRDAGRRVLSGRIGRGVADRIEAVIWFSDLRGFTRISDTAAPDEVIPLLNDYADAVVSAIHDAGGDVLKLIGDGVLAIFEAEDRSRACRCALAAEALSRERIAALNVRRAADGLPVTQTYLGLHAGEVFYGNVGSQERLDFTVVGPAVNEASRIAALCRSVERDILVSSAFAQAATPEDRARFVSVGRYALRGVARAQDLFTLEPDDGDG